MTGVATASSTTRPAPPPSRIRPPDRSGPTAAIAIAMWVTLIVAAYLLVDRLPGAGARVKINAAPLAGVFETRLGWSVVLAVASAVAIVVAGPPLSRRLSWSGLLVAVVAASAGWVVALALIDGWAGLTTALDSPHDYLADVATVGSPGAFLSSFVDEIAGFSVHVQGHPPGLLLVLAGFDRIGLGGVGFAAALFIGVGASAAAAVLVGVREVAGEEPARRAAPFVVLAPVAIWIGSSADALYAGVGAWAATLVVLATGRQDGRGDVYAVSGGLLFGALAFLSYGAVLLILIPCALAWRRRRARPLLLAAIGMAPMFIVFAAAGFSWFAGLLATRERYFEGVAAHRPYAVFLVVNAAALAIALGPAVAVALARLRDRRLGLLVVATLAMVGIALLSGMSKGEVERIWLPFAMWMLPVCAVLAMGSEVRTRGWLALQGTTALVIATLVRTPW